MFLSHIVVSLPLFLPPCPLYKNKQIKSLKIYFKKFHVLHIEQIGISFSFSGAWLFKPLCPSESAWGLSKNYRFSATSRTRPPQKEGSNICIDSSSWSSLVKKHSAIVFYKICIQKRFAIIKIFQHAVMSYGCSCATLALGLSAGSRARALAQKCHSSAL